MLVLGRKIGQSIYIGDDIEVVLVRAADGKARIGIKAPKDLNVVRAELVTPQPVRQWEKKSDGK